MGPKAKKGGKAKKAEGGGGENGDALSDANRVKLYESALTSLQMQLADRSAETGRALAEKRLMQQEVIDAQNQLEETNRGTCDITRDMTRQYKSMQEELLQRINELERTVQVQREELDGARHRNEILAQEKDRVIESKDQEINAMRTKMDDMAQEFGDMLKETLDRMRERVEVSSAGFDPFEDPLLMQSRITSS